MCVGVESFYLKQERDFKKDYNLLQGVGSYGLKQNHNAMWRQVWNNKTPYNNATKLGSFLGEFFWFYFYISFFKNYIFFNF